VNPIGHRTERGFTLIELLVAICVGGIVALALTQQVLVAHRARRTGAKWMRATQLAAERLERLRAGDRGADNVVSAGFTVSWQGSTALSYPDLERVAVTVLWDDQGEKHLTVEALIPAVR
jgi:prepilin-type N-terminal cleavage/methylation domain-containing protein